MPREKTYIAIDLKSFFASVECAERGLDPLDTNLVVADTSRTEKTICLAVSPSLKAYGIPGRARLFEVLQKLKQVNYERKMRSWSHTLKGKSISDRELKEHTDWEIDFIAATPHMAKYIKYSTKIYDIYLKYVSAEDMHVYSIDEVFIDATSYLDTYKKTAHELAMTMIKDVLSQTGITATAGIGTNLYLCKVAMDIVAKHIPADKDGVRIAELDEMSYRQKLWGHKPLTNFWRVGGGIANRLEAYGIDTMGKLAKCSLLYEDFLYKIFGINAELLIDHAWGWEPCTIAQIKAYRPEKNSLGSGQVLQCPYSWEKAKVVVTEMADNLSLELLDKRLVTDQIVLSIGYDTESLSTDEAKQKYADIAGHDHYGRLVPKHSHGSMKLEFQTSSTKMITEAALQVFEKIINKEFLVRRLNITANNVVIESNKEKEEPLQLNLFIDTETMLEQKAKQKEDLAKERKMQSALLEIKKKFGKNAILKGTNFSEGATAKERNQQIGGHKA